MFKLYVFVTLALLASCKKETINPQPEPPKLYRVVIKCLKYEKSTIVTASGWAITTYTCTESKLDTLKN